MMNSKERFLTAMINKKSDMVPVSPERSQQAILWEVLNYYAQ